MCVYVGGGMILVIHDDLDVLTVFPIKKKKMK